MSALEEMYFKKRGIMSVIDATEKAYNAQIDNFYLNQVTRIVHNILKPHKPESTTISAKLRILRRKGIINYKASKTGVYTKL